jgi:hypothetical protein
MVYYTHINRGVIDANRKHGRNDPPVRFQRGKYGKPTYAHEVRLPEGARVVYSADGTLLPCGARLVIVSTASPEVVR